MGRRVNIAAMGLCLVLAGGLAHAQSKTQPKDAAHCVEVGRGKEYKTDKKLKRFLVNRCPRPIEVALCLSSGADPVSRCGSSKKFYRWRFVLEPNKPKYNKYQIPERGMLVWGACYGKYGSIADPTETGGYSCKPPPPSPIDIETEMTCAKGAEPVQFRLRVLFDRKGAKVVEVVTKADKRKRVFSAATIAKWPASTRSDELLVPLPIARGGTTVFIPLTERRLFGAVCDSDAFLPQPSGYPTQIKEWLKKQPTLCLPIGDKKPPDYCFKKTKVAGPVRG